MAWVRVGDEALSHPKLMGMYDVEGAEDISVIEMFGFLMALATYSAKHLTDGIIERGACFRDGERSRVMHLLDVAVAAGLLTWVDIEGRRKLRLFIDEEFIHIQPREEVMRRRARSRENRDKDKKAAVIFRDGDQCRYCGKIVRWTGPIGFNFGTLDHVDPDSLGDAPVEGLVVACHECNSSRGHAREAFDAASPLRPVPSSPYYGEWSAEFLARYGYEAAPSVDPGMPVDPASETPAQGVLPGRGTSDPVDPGRSPRTVSGVVVSDPGTPARRASEGSLQPPQVVVSDPGTPARRASEGSLQPPQVVVSDPGTPARRASEGPRIRPCSDSSPDSSSTSKGISANTLGSGRDGPGRAGKGRAGAGQAGQARARPAGAPRCEDRNKRNRRRRR